MIVEYDHCALDCVEVCHLNMVYWYDVGACTFESETVKVSCSMYVCHFVGVCSMHVCPFVGVCVSVRVSRSSLATPTVCSAFQHKYIGVVCSSQLSRTSYGHILCVSAIPSMRTYIQHTYSRAIWTRPMQRLYCRHIVSHTAKPYIVDRRHSGQLHKSQHSSPYTQNTTTYRNNETNDKEGGEEEGGGGGGGCTEEIDDDDSTDAERKPRELMLLLLLIF